jgi:hypothetical protein
MECRVSAIAARNDATAVWCCTACMQCSEACNNHSQQLIGLLGVTCNRWMHSALLAVALQATLIFALSHCKHFCCNKCGLQQPSIIPD